MCRSFSHRGRAEPSSYGAPGAPRPRCCAASPTSYRNSYLSTAPRSLKWGGAPPTRLSASVRGVGGGALGHDGCALGAGTKRLIGELLARDLQFA